MKSVQTHGFNPSTDYLPLYFQYGNEDCTVSPVFMFLDAIASLH